METFIKFFMSLGKPKYDINNVALFRFCHLSGIILLLAIVVNETSRRLVNELLLTRDIIGSKRKNDLFVVM